MSQLRTWSDVFGFFFFGLAYSFTSPAPKTLKTAASDNNKAALR